jgi:hypothetical protein
MNNNNSFYGEGAKARAKTTKILFDSSRSALCLCGMLLLFAVSNARAQDVKTIKPGMTDAQVREQWGEPLTVKKIGIMSYMYYRSNCLKKCGTNDVVFLENGQVIDAVVRDKSRKYDGIASSPADRKPEPTAPAAGA